jgi:HdeA/HdeB family
MPCWLRDTTNYKAAEETRCSQNIAIWVNGYYHGKRGDVTLDTQGLVENARKLRDYCRRHPQTLVMQAVETLFAKER